MANKPKKFIKTDMDIQSRKRHVPNIQILKWMQRLQSKNLTP